MKHNRRVRTAIAAALVVTAVALLSVSAASAHTSTPAQSQSRTRITIMFGGINKIIYATATLAKNLGYYEKAGVDIYPLDSPAGVEEADALVAGQIDAAMGYYNHTIDLAGKGKATECVVQIGLTPGHAILVPTNSSIKTLADIKGKVMGITGTGSSTDFEMRGFYSADGIMPKDGPRTQYKILAAFEPDLPGKHVNLKATYTNAFALKADKTTPPKAR